MIKGNWQTLSYVNKSTEYYTIPQVLQAFDYGIRIQLHDAEYTTHCVEPYVKYMAIFMKVKQDADEVIQKVREEQPIKDKYTNDQKKILVKANFDRTLAKLFLNGLLGRGNMKLERPQTIVTKNVNDIIHFLSSNICM